MSGAKKFVKSCVFFILRLAVVALPLILLALNTQDLIENGKPTILGTIFFYGLAYWAFGGMLLAGLFEPKSDACCVLFMVLPFLIALAGSGLDVAIREH